MNSSIALRLLWKEYRVQRGLWLSMAGGSIALQALIAFLIPSDQESFQGIVPIAFMLTGFYAVGSGAITFAIEREEGTQLRPVMLGCPPGLTLTVKTIFGIVTTALLLATTICSGMLLTLGSLTLPENTFQPQVQPMIIPLALLFVALPYLGCVLWSTFFSLLTRKVIVALGLAAVAMIVSYIVVAMTSIALVESGQRTRTTELTAPMLFVAALVPCFLALLLLATNYLLTHRWLTRAFFDQTSSKSPSFFKRWRIRRSGFDGGMVVEIGVEDRTAFEVISPEVAVHQPPPRFGLSLLYATWGPNLWRHLRFLRWREAVESRKIFVGFLLATMFLTLWCVGENANNNSWQVAIGFFIHAACVACGAMAFRTEQDERKVQRLADMGLRPATVWISKHLVWFTRAVISVVAILMCVCFVEFLYPYQRSRMGVDDFFHNIWLNRHLPSHMLADFDAGLTTFGRAIILTVTMYGVGQVCSQLIRSTIVSLFVSFVLGLTVFGWAAVCYYFGVPFILSVLPLGIGCLLVTWCRTNSWMIDDNRGRAWLWPAASITAALGIAYFGTGLFRVYEIPWSKPFFSDGSAAEFNDGLTEEQRAFVLAPVTEEERDTFQKYQRAAELLGRRWLDHRPVSKSDVEIWDGFSDAEKLAAEEAIELTLEAAASPACAEFAPAETNLADVASTSSIIQFRRLSDLILIDAHRKMRDGELNAVLDRVHTVFAIARHASGRGTDWGWGRSQQSTHDALTLLQELAKHPDFDDALLGKALDMIDKHRKQMLPVEVVNYTSALILNNTLGADAFTIAELVGGSARFHVLLASKFPGELSRSQRLLNTTESYDVQRMASYRSQQAISDTGRGSGMTDWFHSSQGVDPESSNSTHFALQTTPFFSMIAGGSAGDQLCIQDTDTECRIRATKLVLQLLQVRKESGELPVTLDDFDASLNDPWTGKPFRWHPLGLPGDLKTRNSVLVEANTPFLMTFRLSQAMIGRVEYQDKADAERFGGDAIDGLGLPSSESDDIDGTEETKARVEYVLNGGREFSTPNVIIWQLPKQADAGTESSN